MELQLSPRAVATLVHRLCTPKLTPVAKAAHRHEAAMRRVFLNAVKEVQDAIPMDQLLEVLNLGIGGTGAPLYVLQPVFDMLLEQTALTHQHSPYMRAAAAAGGTVSGVLGAALADGAGAGEFCVVPSPTPTFIKSSNKEWRVQGQNAAGEAFDFAFAETKRSEFIVDTLAKASKVLGVDAEDLALRMASTYANLAQEGFVNIRALDNSVIIRMRYGGPSHSSSTQISRIFSRDAVTGVLRVEHDIFELPSILQGRGIATQVLADSLKTYEALGIQHVELVANLDVGGYAWGRLGFQATNPDAFKSAMMQSMRYESQGLTAARIQELSDGITRAGANAPEWLASQPEGKKIMLGTSWNAQMNLGSAEGRTFVGRVQDKALKGKGK